MNQCVEEWKNFTAKKLFELLIKLSSFHEMERKGNISSIYRNQITLQDNIEGNISS